MTPATFSNIKTIPTAEYVAVVAAMAGYLDGLEVGNFQRITEAL